MKGSISLNASLRLKDDPSHASASMTNPRRLKISKSCPRADRRLLGMSRSSRTKGRHVTLCAAAHATTLSGAQPADRS
jgi:hypothetical protein